MRNENQLYRILPIFSFFICFSFLFCGEKETATNHHVVNSATNPKPSNQVKVVVKWEYTSLPLTMEIREPSGAQSLTLWTTGSIPEGKRTPFGELIPDSQIVLKPGSKKQFVLVMKNPTNDPVYFFAAPHSALPVEHSFGFKFKCLCVNHAFSVPPKETWYRVVEIRLSSDYLGDHLNLTHNLIGITKERMLQFEKNATKSIPTEMD
ncbi:hypothetical protein LEP1GSC202_2829 [Leptospira yanagawae serovar Saopaulo str. Sao Paulo = ATCC 700523]|uniref:Lipoprotein n=1 Tax=Leptospira yanagawae serovar Saopaulo str. Sao Paulo = ATCC 700523 TaxID=1249483 RepID=A0A5E8HBJ3_9LEPT|nr:hypothetical protein LEP1GSC202_2829 [Leptospira yanagawae serovar Saopaulo str. Sao Paulo = ATCC 700523]